MSEDFDRIIAASSSCDLDEIDYPFINPSIEQGADDPQDLDPEFKASSLLMAIDSGDDIQATPETCLLINKTLQEVVNDLLRIIAKEVQGIEIAKMHVVQPTLVQMQRASHISHLEMDNGLPSDALDHLSKPRSYTTIHQQFFNPLRSPYFQRPDLSRPPLNVEAKLRRDRGEFNQPDFIHTVWRQRDNRRLIRAVALDIRQRQLVSLTRELQKKEDEYNEWLIAGPKSKAMKKEIDKLVYRLAKLQASSDEAFVNRPMTREEVDAIDWMKISASDFEGSVSDFNLRLIWMNQFNKTNNYCAWTKKEDEALKIAIGHFGLHAWEKVAEAMGTKRTPFMCIQRYQQRLAVRPSSFETSSVDLDGGESALGGPWSPKEDARLMELVGAATDEQGVIHWAFVNGKMDWRSLNECHTRWSRISPDIQHGAFTEREDLQLLLGVQRYGSENFDLVTAKCLAHRDPRDCRKRYLQLTCDLASEWTYEEDRKLFLLMEKVEETYRFRIKAGPTKSISIPQRCYKDLLIHLPGRTWQTIRNRHRLLKSWHISYLNLRRMVCQTHHWEKEKGRTEMCLERLEANRRWTREEVRAVFLRTPFMLNLLEKLQSAGARSAEFIQDIFSSEPTTKMEALETSVAVNLELDPMLRDAAEGIIVPRPLRRDRWMQILRHTELRMVLETRVRDVIEMQLAEELGKRGNTLEDVMMDPNMNMTRRAQVLHTLLEDEDRFLLAMEQALRFPTIARYFHAFSKSVLMHIDIVPQIVRRCVIDTQQVLFPPDDLLRGGGDMAEGSFAAGSDEAGIVRQTQRPNYGYVPRLRRLAMMVKFNHCFQIFEANRRFDRVRRLMRWKQTPMNGLPPSEPEERQKIVTLLSAALRGSAASESSQLETIARQGRAKLPCLPPSFCSISAFSSLLHFRALLLPRAHFHLESLFKSRLLAVRSTKRREMRHEMQSFVESNTPPFHRNTRLYKSLVNNRELETHRNVLRDPRYLLLKARMFALFLWPALLAAGKVDDVLLRLGTDERLVRPLSSPRRAPRRSRRPLPWNCQKRKELNAAIRRRIQERHKAAGIDSQELHRARRRKAYWMNRPSGNPTWRLRSAVKVPPDLMRVRVSRQKTLVMPFATLELMQNGYQLDSYFPIDESESGPSHAEEQSSAIVCGVKEELMEE